MSLPVVNLRATELDLGEHGTLRIRSLSRAEFHKLRACGADLERAEALTVSCSTGCTFDEAVEWLNSTDIDLTTVVLDAIIELSGLGDTPKD